MDDKVLTTVVYIDNETSDGHSTDLDSMLLATPPASPVAVESTENKDMSMQQQSRWQMCFSDNNLLIYTTKSYRY